MFNKKRLLLTSLIFSAVFIVPLVMLLSGACGAQTRVCKDFFAYTSSLTFIFPSVLILLLLVYKLSDQVYLSWVRFVKWWVPLSIILTILTPETTGSSFVPFVGRGHVAFALSGIFVVVSLILIIWKSLAARRHASI